MRGNDERRSPAEGASTEAEVSAFEAVLIDPMQEKDEELKDRQFVTALARGLELLRCFTPRESLLGNRGTGEDRPAEADGVASDPHPDPAGLSASPAA